MTLEAASLPTVSHKSQKRLISMLKCQATLGRFNVPLTDAVAKALGPQRIPLDLACTTLTVSGYTSNEAALTHPRPYLDAVLAAGSVAIRKVTSGRMLCRLVVTLIELRCRREHAEAPVGNALAATAACAPN